MFSKSRSIYHCKTKPFWNYVFKNHCSYNGELMDLWFFIMFYRSQLTLFSKTTISEIVKFLELILNIIWDFSWNLWGILVSHKIKINGFLQTRHVQKSRNHRNEKLEGSPITTLKSYKIKLKQNNTMELLSIYFI